VTEAVDGEILQKGHVYIAPGGRHMEIVKAPGGAHQIRLNDNPPIDALRPCANVMYNSLTDSDFGEITCVVLTGMGADGTKGITNLAGKKKVHVIAQDKDTCVVYGMPKAIAEAGLADEVKPLDEIANTIIRSVGVS
ncbi:MAG: CheB methylesterase domain-containing protein, partial [Alistipes sp.]|nr:CheB methylesterase domain-containing protein [Alistipes sp.]